MGEQGVEMTEPNIRSCFDQWMPSYEDPDAIGLDPDADELLGLSSHSIPNEVN